MSSRKVGGCPAAGLNPACFTGTTSHVTLGVFSPATGKDDWKCSGCDETRPGGDCTRILDDLNHKLELALKDLKQDTAEYYEVGCIADHNALYDNAIISFMISYNWSMINDNI